MGDAVRRTIMTVAETFRRKRERADPGCVRRSQELAISFHRCRAGSVRLLSIERTIRLGFRICYGHRTIKTGMFSRLPPPAPPPKRDTRIIRNIITCAAVGRGGGGGGEPFDGRVAYTQIPKTLLSASRRPSGRLPADAPDFGGTIIIY